MAVAEKLEKSTRHINYSFVRSRELMIAQLRRFLPTRTLFSFGVEESGRAAVQCPLFSSPVTPVSCPFVEPVILFAITLVVHFSTDIMVHSCGLKTLFLLVEIGGGI